MDPDTLRGALEAATRQVLEDVAFVFTEPTAEPVDETSWSGSVIRAELPFTGPIRGRFVLAASSALFSSLAAEMLGVEPGDVEAEERESAPGEILNMVAGMTLEQTLGDVGLWELGVPEARSMSPAEYMSAPRADILVRLDTEEEEPFEVGVFVINGDS